MAFPLHRLKDRFYLDSFLVFVSTLILSGLGLLFWIVAAKIYPDGDVGIATAILSTITLIMSISRFGFDQSIIRYFPVEDKGKVFGTAIAVTAFLSLLFGSFFLLGTEFWAKDLIILNEHPILFLSIILLSGLTTITGMAFIALRRPVHASIANAVSGVRIPVLYIFVAGGAMGIVISAGVGFFFCLLYGLLILAILKVRPKWPDIAFLKKSFSFSAGNYFVGLLNSAAGLLLPLIVLNKLGANETAYFYMAYSIANIVFMIPSALGTTIFVDGSHGGSLEQSTRKAFRGALIFLIPIALIALVAGGPLLSLIGKQYESGGLALMQLLILSSVPFVYMSTFISTSKVRGDIPSLIGVGIFNFVAIMISSVALIGPFGLVGVGYAWILSYLATSGLIYILLKTRR